ncbi:casein kinase II regulatory subunit [Cooperia oncophora]
MSSSGTAASWVGWFCSNRGNEFFCEVDEDYIGDNFNLTGLSDYVPKFREALDKILDLEPDDSGDDSDGDASEVERLAERLYGLIHASDIYYPKHARHQSIDGAYFGTSFPEMFLMMYPEYRRPKPQQFEPRLAFYKCEKVRMQLWCSS